MEPETTQGVQPEGEAPLEIKDALVTPEPERKRRRMTPEQRIAERKAEIERIEHKQRQRVLAMIAEATDVLRQCVAAARATGNMGRETRQCVAALDQLGAKEQA